MFSSSIQRERLLTFFFYIIRVYSGNVSPFFPSASRKKNCILKYNYLTVGLTISLAGNLPDPAQPALYSPNYCLHHPSLTRQAILPLISAWKRNRAGRSGNESFSQIGAWVHSSLPVRPACQEGLGPRCVGGDAFETEWSHTACLPPKTHEGGLCLPRCEEEGEGALTAQQRVAGGEMRPIFSSEHELLFKD